MEKQRKYYAISVLMLLALAAAADADMVTSASCTVSVSGVPITSQSDPHSCALDTLLGRASATVSETASISSAGFAASLTGSSFAFADAGDYPKSVTVTGQAYGSLSYSLYTNGPTRPGFIQINLTGSIPPEAQAPEIQQLTVGVGGLTESCIYAGGTACGGNVGPCAGSVGSCTVSEILPFTLGQAFNFTGWVDFQSEDQGNNLLNSPSGAGSVTLSFGLFEADGTTPVPINLVAPEPPPAALFWWGLPAAVLMGLKRFKTSPELPKFHLDSISRVAHTKGNLIRQVHFGAVS